MSNASSDEVETGQEKGIFGKALDFFVEVTPSDDDQSASGEEETSQNTAQVARPAVSLHAQPGFGKGIVSSNSRALVDPSILEKLMQTLDEEASTEVSEFLSTYHRLCKVQSPQQAFAGAMAVEEVTKDQISSFIEQKKVRLAFELSGYSKVLEENRQERLAVCNNTAQTIENDLQEVSAEIVRLQNRQTELLQKQGLVNEEVQAINSECDQNKAIFEATVQEAEKRLADESNRLLS